MNCPNCKKRMRQMGTYTHEDGRVYVRWMCGHCHKSITKRISDEREG